MSLNFISSDEIEMLNAKVLATGAVSADGSVLTTLDVEGQGRLQQWADHAYPVGKAVTLEVIQPSSEYPTVIIHEA